MPTIQSVDIGELAIDFGRRPDISARSVLVTIFGDSIVPAGGRLWLGDLIGLCAPFGFNERLVRTSIYRLTTEGWFETERVGRRSRYQLTASAREEFAAAEARIYQLPEIDWDGRWTMVLLGEALSTDERRALRETLRWRGFAPITTDVMALPGRDLPTAQAILRRAGLERRVAIAVATFADLAPLVDGSMLESLFGLTVARAGYESFLDRYRWTAELAVNEISDQHAFLLRTMLVHELRRPRLADPDLPDQLTPADWPASEAMELAGATYRLVAEPANHWLVDQLALEKPPEASPTRFSKARPESR